MAPILVKGIDNPTIIAAYHCADELLKPIVTHEQQLRSKGTRSTTGIFSYDIETFGGQILDDWFEFTAGQKRTLFVILSQQLGSCMESMALCQNTERLTRVVPALVLRIAIFIAATALAEDVKLRQL
jgi:hypothetical protein